jgi:hypothetical protein
MSSPACSVGVCFASSRASASRYTPRTGPGSPSQDRHWDPGPASRTVAPLSATGPNRCSRPSSLAHVPLASFRCRNWMNALQSVPACCHGLVIATRYCPHGYSRPLDMQSFGRASSLATVCCTLEWTRREVALIGYRRGQWPQAPQRLCTSSRHGKRSCKGMFRGFK